MLLRCATAQQRWRMRSNMNVDWMLHTLLFCALSLGLGVLGIAATV
jgi:hypothetical protein